VRETNKLHPVSSPAFIDAFIRPFVIFLVPARASARISLRQLSCSLEQVSSKPRLKASWVNSVRSSSRFFTTRIARSRAQMTNERTNERKTRRAAAPPRRRRLHLHLSILAPLPRRRRERTVRSCVHDCILKPITTYAETSSDWGGMCGRHAVHSRVVRRRGCVRASPHSPLVHLARRPRRALARVERTETFFRVERSPPRVAPRVAPRDDD